MSERVPFCNFTDNIAISVFDGKAYGMMVHPAVAAALITLLRLGGDQRAVAEAVINAQWFPGVITNNIDNTIPALHDAYFEMTVEERAEAAKYNAISRLFEVDYFPERYLVERFDATTRQFQHYRDFYLQLKHAKYGVDFGERFEPEEA